MTYEWIDRLRKPSPSWYARSLRQPLFMSEGVHGGGEFRPSVTSLLHSKPSFWKKLPCELRWETKEI